MDLRPIILKPRGVSPYDAVSGSNIYILRKKCRQLRENSRLESLNPLYAKNDDSLIYSSSEKSQIAPELSIFC